MKLFRTEIQVEEFLEKIDYDTQVVFMGSCFADNVGEKFKQHRLNALVNPYGVMYNPMSVANTLSFMIKNKQFVSEELDFHGEHWHSFYHHSSFSDRDKSNCLKKININNTKAHDYLKQTKIIFITFGTAWVYQLKHNEQVVSNCHKYPAKSFNRYILNIDEIVARYKDLLTELLVFNPDAKVIFTVSPVRHWKDGAHGNQISKSTLLLAIESLTDQFLSCSYFPAYELLMDDLRDYRFYKDDMLHPNNTAIEYIWEKFEKSFFSTNALDYLKEMSKLGKALSHRSFDSSSESYQNFLVSHINRLGQLKSKYSKVDFSEDLNSFKSRMI